jgi:hypothetical protein
MDSNQANWSHYNHSGRSWEISVSQKLALYGSSALSGIEHLRLLVGQDSVADALVRHFGSLQALQRASFRELRQFLTARQAESVMPYWLCVLAESLLIWTRGRVSAVFICCQMGLAVRLVVEAQDLFLPRSCKYLLVSPHFLFLQ